ncbi:MAG: hypothetical protein WAT67_06160 [Candidatus Contendobacter sp.]
MQPTTLAPENDLPFFRINCFHEGGGGNLFAAVKQISGALLFLGGFFLSRLINNRRAAGHQQDAHQTQDRYDLPFYCGLRFYHVFKILNRSQRVKKSKAT